MLQEDQVDARSASNFDELKSNNKRKCVNTTMLPHTETHRYEDTRQRPQQIPRNRVKFEQQKVNATLFNGYEKVPKMKKEFRQQPATSSDESVLECQFYTNDESEKESAYGDDDETSRAFSEMEKKMNAMTDRYLRRIKSQLTETCSKLKLQQKQSKLKYKTTPKYDEKAAGDVKNNLYAEGDSYIEKFKQSKADCYKKIDENLKILRHIDSVTDDLYNNYLGNNGNKNCFL